MEREIRIRITPDGKVEIDSTVFKDCKEVAEHLSRVLGEVESFHEKDEFETGVRIEIESEG